MILVVVVVVVVSSELNRLNGKFDVGSEYKISALHCITTSIRGWQCDPYILNVSFIDLFVSY